jgi:hypothetical protein
MAKILQNIDALKARKNAYHTVFANPIGQEVLRDLAQFCRATETCFHKDPRVHAALEGRREVFLRISQHLNLTVDQLFTLFGGQYVELQQPDEVLESNE